MSCSARMWCKGMHGARMYRQQMDDVQLRCSAAPVLESFTIRHGIDQASAKVKEMWAAFTKTEPVTNTNALFFFYQNGKVVLTDGSEMSLTGKCVYAVRGPTPLKVPSEDITLGFMENDVLGQMEKVLGSAFTPVLKSKDGAFIIIHRQPHVPLRASPCNPPPPSSSAC